MYAFRVVFYSVNELHTELCAQNWWLVLMIFMLLADSLNHHSTTATQQKIRRPPKASPAFESCL
jgi:hypothetical protein